MERNYLHTAISSEKNTKRDNKITFSTEWNGNCYYASVKLDIMTNHTDHQTHIMFCSKTCVHTMYLLILHNYITPSAYLGSLPISNTDHIQGQNPQQILIMSLLTLFIMVNTKYLPTYNFLNIITKYNYFVVSTWMWFFIFKKREKPTATIDPSLNSK